MKRMRNSVRRSAQGRGLRRAAMTVLAVVLATASCMREAEDPVPPRSPPRPTLGTGGGLMHAHYHLPAPPLPPPPGMM